VLENCTLTKCSKMKKKTHHQNIAKHKTFNKSVMDERKNWLDKNLKVKYIFGWINIHFRETP
jgi:hypothetical protein